MIYIYVYLIFESVCLSEYIFFFFPAKYIGCYVDNTQKRALRGVSFFDYKKMTVFRCQDNCAERYDKSKQQKTLIHYKSIFL